ncbi:hypothetical protein C8J57DRAFT_1565198 [Mycena rebaudengoi]|nr:hypothetical protein C8J57DRAFT_1565198 [Mycena rebaudengoi]
MLTDPYTTASLCEELSAGTVLRLETYISDPVFMGMFNPDMMGFVVRLSSVVLNLLKGILIAWGTKADSDAALTALLVQMGSVVLCTHISIIRGQLTFIDGFFALTIVNSPIAGYIIWTNLPQLYYWIRGDKKMQNWNSALVVVLFSGWISLHALVWIKGRKFPGENCGSMSAKTYFSSVVLSGILSSISPIGTAALLFPLVFYPIYAFHHSRRGSFALAKRKGLSRFDSSVLLQHRLPVYFIIFYSYIYWLLAFALDTVEAGYDFSYGQSLSVVAATPTMIVTLRMLLSTPLKRVDRGVAYLVLDLLFFLFGDPEKLPARIKRTKFGAHLVLVTKRICRRAPSHPLARSRSSMHVDSIPLSADPVSPTSRLEVERADSLDITVEHANSLADDHDPFESTRLPSRLGWITPVSEYPSSYMDILFPRSTSPVEMHALRGATLPPQRLPDRVRTAEFKLGYYGTKLVDGSRIELFADYEAAHWF